MISPHPVEATTNKSSVALVEQQYTSALIVMSLLVIVFHPAFHFILRQFPGNLPDSLLLRLVSVGVSAVLLAAVLLHRPLQNYSSRLQIVNATTALVVTHLLVLNTRNHPMYLAASLTAVYAAQLCFLRMREWIITVAIVSTFYVLASAQRGEFTTPGGYVTPLFYVANYTIATGLTAVRVRLQRRDLQSRLALQQSHAELRLVNERLQSELELARQIQQSLLPPAHPDWALLDVVCYSRPAREVGGDFYSYHHFNDRHVALAVGDVSGKGASAALLMATSLSLFNAQVVRRPRPHALMAELDRSLAPYTQPRGQNCALCYLELDGSTLCIVNAGGIPPYIRRQDGRVEQPDAWGFPLGHVLGAEIGYDAARVMVAPGDMIVLVSDGVVEATTPAGEMFSFARVEQAIADGPATSSQAMVDHLLAEITRFAGAAEAHDDLTIVAARVCEE
ncbi:MAG TPA: PP2C family protein-serine/threonine phosphatase [Herpetosiphonaceae bacterium]|nr:PP2C family protein-serine/threonine phosphatase [Herpetosiphonaceae bacterium]